MGAGTSTGAGVSAVIVLVLVVVLVLGTGLRDDHPSSAYPGNRSVGSTKSWEKKLSEDEDDEYEDDYGELLAPSDLRPMQRYSCDD